MVYCAGMQLTPPEVQKIATLARLSINETEAKDYAEQLSVIFDYFSMLNEVDTEGVKETCQVTGLEDAVRDDVVNNCDEETRKKIIKAFPEKIGVLLKVKGVFVAE
jgi:aspartyl-tRNA(Asn)/glutamyl-tRNA(Gln) amidotransferase subunit C